MIQKNLANVVTSLRILLMPVLLYLLLTGNKMAFFYVAVVIMMTDAVDGTIARMLKQETDFGRKLDSFADFGFYPVFSIGTMLLLQVYAYIPVWLLILPLVLSLFSIIVFPFLYIKRVAFLHLRSWQATTYGLLLFCIVSFLYGVSVPLYYLFLTLSIVASIEETCIYLRDGKAVNSDIHSFFDKPKNQRN